MSLTLLQLDISEACHGSISWGEVYGGHMVRLLADYGLLMFLCISKDIMLSLYRYCVFVCEYVYVKADFMLYYCRVSVVRYN